MRDATTPPWRFELTIRATDTQLYFNSWEGVRAWLDQRLLLPEEVRLFDLRHYAFIHPETGAVLRQMHHPHQRPKFHWQPYGVYAHKYPHASAT